MSMHVEWLSLIEISGAFLAEPILDQAFPQGLEGLETSKKQAFRQTYEEWREALDTEDELQARLHQEWINWVLKTGLEWDEDDEGDELKAGADVPADLKLELLEHNLTLKPDYALFANDATKPYLLVASYPAHIELTDTVAGDGWSTTPAERMSHLCRATGTRLGLVTNGEQWMVVDAPEGGITSYASWYARLWSQEPVTLKAFFSLLNIRTVFSGFGLEAKKLTELLDDSLKHQDEVTETLGAQVQRAVEVLIQSIDRINNDSNGELLNGVEPTELYEAGLTYMMRLVFLLCAEERGLLLLGDETYEANYAVSTLRMKLREEAGLHGEEVLSYRNNAWARLLAVFRAVYGGVEHESMRMPALGGSLFDPDRFPFLEGRSKESSWKIDEARPLPIDNRTVLLFLDAIQLFKGRTLSYRALDVEQIGYVYEGLLERTVIRSTDVTLELSAKKNSKKPWVLLGELASAELDGVASVKKLLEERTGSQLSRVTNDFAKEVSEAESERLLLACQNDAMLRDRIKPYYNFLRVDAWGNPLLYPKGSFMVATGADRRETGTHYTPKSLTESVVLDTLEPLVYIGPLEGKARSDWELKSSAEILDLKVCDLAMGSGAFLVQACRYMADRLLESWREADSLEKRVTNDGVVVDTLTGQEALSSDSEERLFIARRLVSERCLYGVDINPLAVELTKLSIWLVTLAKGRPFGFLDHNLKYGDSLLGVTDLDQLYYLDMKPTKLSEGGGISRQLFSQKIEKAVKEAIELRSELRQRPILDIGDVEVMVSLDQKAQSKVELPTLIADSLVGKTLISGGKNADVATLSINAGEVFEGISGSVDLLREEGKHNINADVPPNKRKRKAFHWCLEFPEVFDGELSGFDAVIGNPPFLGGQKITGAMGNRYREYLIESLANGKRGSADFVAYFFLRAESIVNKTSRFTLIASNSISQGDTREVGLDQVVDKATHICSAIKSYGWPGQATVSVAILTLTKQKPLNFTLDGRDVPYIDTSLSDGSLNIRERKKIKSNKAMCSIGSYLQGTGFYVKREKALTILSENIECAEVLKPLIRGDDIINTYNTNFQYYGINFGNRNIEESKRYTAPFEIAEKNVKPERKKGKDSKLAEFWWKYKRQTPSLYKKASALERVLVHGFTSKYIGFRFVPSDSIFVAPLVVFFFDSYGYFGVLQSSIHKSWVENVSSMRNDIRYAPSDCFETFPFPPDVDALRNVGEKYYAIRDNLMLKSKKGMTETYNVFHDKNTNSKDIENLRQAEVELDMATLKSYGWDDILLNHDFYDGEKGVRFTICNEARNEILARLLHLNNEASEAEQNSVLQKKDKSLVPKGNAEKNQPDMFDN